MASAAPTRFTVRCYHCGKRIPEEEAHRRQVSVGSVSGLAGGFFDISTWFLGSFQQRQDLCPECAERHDRRQRFWWRVGLFLLGGVLMLLAALLISTALGGHLRLRGF
jgi:hypothetical protein